MEFQDLEVGQRIIFADFLIHKDYGSRGRSHYDELRLKRLAKKSKTRLLSGRVFEVLCKKTYDKSVLVKAVGFKKALRLRAYPEEFEPFVLKPFEEWL